MTVRALLAELTSGELSEWMAFDSIEPIGQARDDFNAARVGQFVIAAAGGKPGTLSEMAIPWQWDDPTTVEEQVERAMRALGGTTSKP